MSSRINSQILALLMAAIEVHPSEREMPKPPKHPMDEVVLNMKMRQVHTHPLNPKQHKSKRKKK